MANHPTDIKITDTELLLCINRLRRAEDRQPLIHLPLPYSFLSDEQRYNIYNRYDSEYRIHLRDKARFLDYKFQIILNKTEHKLYVHNKARAARSQPQIHFLPFKNIATQDVKYYFPNSRITQAQKVFVTDTDSKYITSVIQVTSGKTSQIRASHTFHLSVSFNEPLITFDPPRSSSPEYFTPQSSVSSAQTLEKSTELPPILFKDNFLPRVYPDLSDIFEIKMSSPSKRRSPSPLKRTHGSTTPSRDTTPNPPITHHTVEFSPSKLAAALEKANIMGYRDQTTLHSSTETLANPLWKQHQVEELKPPPNPLGAIPKGTRTQGQSEPFKNPNLQKPDDAKDKMLEEAHKATQLLIQQNTELRNNIIMMRLQCDEMALKQRESPQKTTPFPSPTPPLTPREITPIDPPRIPISGGGKSSSLIAFTPPKLSSAPVSLSNSPVQFRPSKLKTENSEVDRLKLEMAQLAAQFGSIKIKMAQTDKIIESSKLTDVEKKALDKIAKKVAPEASTLIYALAKPTNLIPETEVRDPRFLAILKGHAAIATLGTFDPDKNTRADFRDIWDRILNYTKNYKMYEHEYVDLLMTVMKGSAATILNGMIREYKGDLETIIEAIQDIYIPQHTIYDDVEELNKFKRLPNENIKSMMRRASMIIEKLKPTCTEAAWPDRKYHLLLTLLKQLIDKKTFKHLHSKELEAAQIGTQMEMKEIIMIVALYEATHELIPRNETGLVYNINSLQVMNCPDPTAKEIEKLKLQINSLMPKKPRMESRPNPYQKPSTGGLKRTHQGIQRNSPFSSSQASSFSSLPKPLFQNTQRRSNGMRDFKSSSIGSQNSNKSFSGISKWINANPSGSSTSSRPILSANKWRENRSKSRERNRNSQSGSNYSYPLNFRQSRSYSRSKSNDRFRNGYDRQRSNSRGRSPSRTRYNYLSKPSYMNQQRGRSLHKSFEKGTNTVTMTFYQCKLCPKTHLKGTPCNSNKQY